VTIPLTLTQHVLMQTILRTCASGHEHRRCEDLPAVPLWRPVLERVVDSADYRHRNTARDCLSGVDAAVERSPTVLSVERNADAHSWAR
jgi:hypothetical protein